MAFLICSLSQLWTLTESHSFPIHSFQVITSPIHNTCSVFHSWNSSCAIIIKITILIISTIIAIIVFIFGIIINIILISTANIIFFLNLFLTADKIAVDKSKQAKYYICIAVVYHSRTSINCMVSLVSLKSVLFQKQITFWFKQIHHMSAWYSCTFFNCTYCDFLCTFSNHLTWKSLSTSFVSIVFCCYTLLLYITMPVPGHPSALPFKFFRFIVYCFNHNNWDVLILSQVLFIIV